MLQATQGLVPVAVRSLLRTIAQPIVVNTAIKAVAYRTSSLIRRMGKAPSNASRRLVFLTAPQAPHASSQHGKSARQDGFFGLFDFKFKFPFGMKAEVKRQPATTSRPTIQQQRRPTPRKVHVVMPKPQPKPQPPPPPPPKRQPQPQPTPTVMGKGGWLAEQEFGNALAEIIESGIDAYRRIASRRARPRVKSDVPPVDHSEDLWDDAPKLKADVPQPPQHIYPEMHSQESNQPSDAWGGSFSGDSSSGSSGGSSDDSSGDSSGDSSDD